MADGGWLEIYSDQGQLRRMVKIVLRRRCEIQERLIAAFEKLCEGTTFCGHELVDYRQAKAELAALDKEHGDG